MAFRPLGVGNPVYELEGRLTRPHRLQELTPRPPRLGAGDEPGVGPDAGDVLPELLGQCRGLEPPVTGLREERSSSTSMGSMRRPAFSSASQGRSSRWRPPMHLLGLGRVAAVLAGLASLWAFWPRRFDTLDLYALRQKYLSAELRFTKL